MFDSMFNSIPGRKLGVDFLLDNQMNFEGCSIWCSILFDTEPEVDIQVFCRSVVVVQARRRCSGTSSLSCCSCSLFVVRCSAFITQNFQDLVLYDVHSLTTAVATEGLSSIYTISGGRGLDLLCRRR